MTRVATLAALGLAASAVAQPVISYATFLGGDGTDIAYAVAPFPDGGVVVAGRTTSTNFPMVGSLTPQGSGGFVTRFNAAATDLVYSTGLGTGSGSVYITGLVVDAAGNAFVAGSVSDPNLQMKNPIQGTIGGGYDAFVAELSPTGALLFSTFFGGPSNEDGYALAVDGAGLIYIVGEVDGPGMPTVHAWQPVYGGSNDQFVVKIDPAAHAFAFATYLGGSSDDRGIAAASDGFGGVYVGGSGGAGFPTRNAAYPNAFGNYDGTLTRIGIDGGISFSTFVGGSGYDLLNGLAARPGGGVIAVGDTASTDMATLGAFQTSNGGGHDAFVLAVAGDGAVLYQTYFGGSSDDTAYGVAVRPDGTYAIAGSTMSADLPSAAGLQPGIALDGGAANAFVASFAAPGPLGSPLLLSTWLGGGGDFVNLPFADYISRGESGNAVAFDATGDLFVAGETPSKGFATVAPFQAHVGGGDDAFLVKISFYVDAGLPDAGSPDAGTPDAGMPDGGAPDSGPLDAGTPDAGMSDAGMSDAGVPDAGAQDAGPPDAGPVSTDGGTQRFYVARCGCDGSGFPSLLVAFVLALRKGNAYPTVLRKTSRVRANELSACRPVDAGEPARARGRRSRVVPLT